MAGKLNVPPFFRIFALDENGDELEDIEDKNVTLNEFCKKYNLL